MFEVTFFSALLGGVLTFFAPCTLPLIPGYLAFIGGEKKQEKFQRRIMWNAVLFVLGFSLVFIAYGVASGAAGKFLVLHRQIISEIGGVIVIFFGLSLLGIFSLHSLRSFFTSFGGAWRKWPRWISSGSPLGAFVLGFLFALGWSPCLGPILGTILLLAATQGTIIAGALLLGVYSLGLAAPFLLIAFFYGSSFAYVPQLAAYLPAINKIGGIVIVLVGLLLVLGQFGILNTWAGALLGDRFFNAMVQYM